MTLTAILWLSLNCLGLMRDSTAYSQEFPLPALRKCASLAEIDGPENVQLFWSGKSLGSDFLCLINTSIEISGCPRASRLTQFASYDLEHLERCALAAADYFASRIPRTTDLKYEYSALEAECRRVYRIYFRIRVGFDPTYTTSLRRKYLQEVFDEIGEESWYAGRLPQPPTFPR